MKDEWRRFFLQWVLPVVIFIVVIVFMFASFTANIKQETVTNYEEDMVVASGEYAGNITSSLRKMEAVAEALIDVIVDNNLANFGASDVLRPLVKDSEAYMAMLVAENDKVVTEEGKSFQGTPKVRVVSAVGAGDSFTGAFIGSLFNGESFERAHMIAVKVSAYVCTQKGAMPTIPDSARTLTE